MHKPLCIFLCTFAGALAASCSSGPPAGLRKDDPSVRIPAIKRAVRSRDLASAPQMVRDLRSDDPAIRLYAIEGLRRLTGEDLGYRYYQTEPARLEATRKWERWLKEQKGKVSGASSSSPAPVSSAP